MSLIRWIAPTETVWVIASTSSRYAGSIVVCPAASRTTPEVGIALPSLVLPNAWITPDVMPVRNASPTAPAVMRNPPAIRGSVTSVGGALDAGSNTRMPLPG